ncbi:hypothetical protein ACN077_20865 [Clostridium chromiireducens]|uniref:hypothetical protein n=1 Tax=Clostridium chromiireducens TaxID=225345 RepID=UPI003AF5E617
MSNSAYRLDYVTSKQQYEIKRITAGGTLDITKISDTVQQIGQTVWVCSKKDVLIEYVPIIKENMIEGLEKKKKAIQGRNVVVM